MKNSYGRKEIGMRHNLEKIRDEAIENISRAKDLEQLERLRLKYLGKKGELTQVLRVWEVYLLKRGQSWENWQMR